MNENESIVPRPIRPRTPLARIEDESKVNGRTPKLSAPMLLNLPSCTRPGATEGVDNRLSRRTGEVEVGIVLEERLRRGEGERADEGDEGRFGGRGDQRGEEDEGAFGGGGSSLFGVVMSLRFTQRERPVPVVGGVENHHRTARSTGQLRSFTTCCRTYLSAIALPKPIAT